MSTQKEVPLVKYVDPWRDDSSWANLPKPPRSKFIVIIAILMLALGTACDTAADREAAFKRMEARSALQQMRNDDVAKEMQLQNLKTQDKIDRVQGGKAKKAKVK